VASPTEAARHLLSKPYPATTTAGAKNRIAVFMLTVGTDGTVSDVKVQQGDSGLASELSSAVKNWKFTPFVQNGKPTPVKTAVAFVAHADGRIICMF
jgi:outer membrane biosynthesis protein TonB